MPIAIIASAVLLAVIIWLFLVAPSSGRSRCRGWRGTLFAHRGLHGQGCSENSLEAFERACREGYGIELDVQFSRDGQLVVFHDDDTLRMTGAPGMVREKTLDELRRLRLSPDGAAIPTFEETLRLVDSRQPLLVEIKTCPNIGELTRATVEALRKYQGPYVVESFNPLCLWHLRRMAPDVVRGQLVCSFTENRAASGSALSFALSAMLLNFLGRPDFIAYSHSMRGRLSMKIQRTIFKAPLGVWTITDADTARQLSNDGEMPIFEQCKP